MAYRGPSRGQTRPVHVQHAGRYSQALYVLAGKTAKRSEFRSRPATCICAMAYRGPSRGQSRAVVHVQHAVRHSQVLYVLARKTTDRLVV